MRHQPTTSVPGSLPAGALVGLLATTIMSSGCKVPQAYPGAERPADQTAVLQINPPQADIGFELTSVNGYPFVAEENASILAGDTTLGLNVWPTTQENMELSDPAFATLYSMQDSDYARKVTVRFNARPGATYGLNGTFNMGTSPADASYAVEVFDIKSMSVVGRNGSPDPAERSERVIQQLRENRGEQWSVEEGPGS